MTKIFLCASMNFYEELVKIERSLLDKGVEVEIPVSAKTMKAKNDFDVSHFKGVFTQHKKASLSKRILQILPVGMLS